MPWKRMKKWLVFIPTVNFKRIRYIISSLAMAIGFYLYLSLPYEVKYWGLMVGIVLVVFCVWFGLGIVFSGDFQLRLMTILLPSVMFAGLGLFLALLPMGNLGLVIVSIVFGAWCYVMFLVENVFLVSVGYKRVPLYRAAYTVSLLMLLLAGFLMFDTMWSFKMPFWVNSGISFVVGMILFAYQFWAVTIELSDDGDSKSIWAYTIVPALILAEVAFVLSFWPVGIFKGSIYLVSVVYILATLIQAELRERLFRRTWLGSIWVGVAMLLAVILMTGWGV